MNTLLLIWCIISQFSECHYILHSLRHYNHIDTMLHLCFIMVKSGSNNYLWTLCTWLCVGVYFIAPFLLLPCIFKDNVLCLEFPVVNDSWGIWEILRWYGISSVGNLGVWLKFLVFYGTYVWHIKRNERHKSLCQS